MDKNKKIVVVGGVAGGASAATKARRTDEGAEIIMFEQGAYVSFANCGLPYYVGGDIKERDNLFLVTPERFKERFNIDVRVSHQVNSLDRDKKQISGVNLTTGEAFTQDYDVLVLATGGIPLKPPIPE